MIGFSCILFTSALLFVFVDMPLLLSAIAGVLLMHQSLGSVAVDSLTALAIMDPKLGTQFLLAILFYNNIFTKKDNIGQNMLVSFSFIFWTCILELTAGCFMSSSRLYNLDCQYFVNSIVLQLKILGMLPALASHSGMIPLVVQTILPMLQKDSKPYALCDNHFIYLFLL